MKPLLTFPKGGVHPPECKAQTEKSAIEVMPVPDEIAVILGQHIGAPCTPTVAKRDIVTEGAVIGEVRRGLGVPIHAPVSGKIKDISAVPHPVRGAVPAVIIKVDKEATAPEYAPSDWQNLSARELRDMVHQAGIIGVGGAGFPTHVKLRPPADSPVDTLVLNGAECEPYITSDHRQMLEYPEGIIEGAGILLKILGITSCYIGIENNKPEAIAKMQEIAAQKSTETAKFIVQPLKVKYPQGSEKQLIQAVTSRKVPAGALPASVGVVVQNVGTARAIYDAVVYGKPLYDKIVTVAGKGIGKPGNLQVKVGTRVRDIVNYACGLQPGLSKIIMGGPMMGFAVSNLDIPVTKTTSAILFLTEDEIDTRPHSQCIRCGWCLDACPMGLEPKEIGVYVEAGKGEDTKQFGVFDCFECGSCAFVCPAKRPLVQFIRLAKMKAK